MLDTIDTPEDGETEVPAEEKKSKVHRLGKRWARIKKDAKRRKTALKTLDLKGAISSNEGKVITRNKLLGAAVLAGAVIGVWYLSKHGVDNPFHHASSHTANPHTGSRNLPLGAHGHQVVQHGVDHAPSWAHGHEAAYNKLHAAGASDANIHNIIQHPEAFKGYINWAQHATEQMHKEHPKLSDDAIEKILKTRWDRYFSAVNKGSSTLVETL